MIQAFLPVIRVRNRQECLYHGRGRAFWRRQSLQSLARAGQGHRVPETIENARRWSGYVCPECRFVFRVPRDHDGQGIICPGCRRMLKIPAPADTPPPLTAPLPEAEAEEPAADGEGGKTKKRRRGKKARAEKHSWEQQPKSFRVGRREKRQMRLMSVGGAALFALIVAGVIVSMNLGNKRVAAPVGETAAAKNPAAAPVPPAVPRGEASLLAEAEPLTRKFLEATTVEELLPLVRNPAVAEARMRGFYPGGKIKAPGLAKFNSGGGLSIRGKLVSLAVRTRDQEEKSLAFIDTPQGMKIDWESWAGWSEISWEKFLSSKPVTGHVFRVTLTPVDYYNFGFADDVKWQSYRLESPDREHAVFGYVEKGSVLNQRIRPDAETKSVALMLSLKFPEGTASNNQVLIERFVAEGWVEEADPP